MPNREQFDQWMYSRDKGYSPTDDSMFTRICWEGWQAGAAAERERKNENPPCEHPERTAMWDHVACNKCGHVYPDGPKQGRPNGGWFRTMDSFRNWDRSAP